jgi:hypothetical protein
MLDVFESVLVATILRFASELSGAAQVMNAVDNIASKNFFISFSFIELLLNAWA